METTKRSISILSLLLTLKYFLKIWICCFCRAEIWFWNLRLGPEHHIFFFFQWFNLFNLLVLTSFLILVKSNDHLSCRTTVWKRQRNFQALLQNIRYLPLGELFYSNQLEWINGQIFEAERQISEEGFM